MSRIMGWVVAAGLVLGAASRAEAQFGLSVGNPYTGQGFSLGAPAGYGYGPGNYGMGYPGGYSAINPGAFSYSSGYSGYSGYAASPYVASTYVATPYVGTYRYGSGYPAYGVGRPYYGGYGYRGYGGYGGYRGGFRGRGWR